MLPLKPEHHAAARDLVSWLKGEAGTQPYKAAASIDAMVQGYVDDLTRYFLDVLDRGLTVPAAARGHRLSIGLLAERAYDAGMEEGGADPAEKDDTDEQAVTDWETEQNSHVADLWAAVKQLRTDRKTLGKDEYNARQLTINNRLAQWGESLRNLWSLAKANAQRNMTVVWKVGPTEHCATCAELNGQRHRLKWFLDKGYIPQENGSDMLDCHGFNCQCTLEDLKGNTVMP